MWLSHDFENILIWSVGYSADKTRWFNGKAMHLVDRGLNVLERILVESELKTGEIILVGHSLGGLVIKSLLREAESQSLNRSEAADFIQRVRRVCFLGTPHSGSKLSSISMLLRIITRPSLATVSLVSGDPNLRSLNNWYRSWAKAHDIDHLILMESELSKLLGPLKGVIVDPGSADPGLDARAIMVEADHYNICKPKNKGSEVYSHIKSFVGKASIGCHREVKIENKIDSGIEKIENLEYITTEGLRAVERKISKSSEETISILSDKLEEVVSIKGNASAYSHDLFDKEICSRTSLIRKSRFFEGTKTSEKAQKLAKDIIDGELSNGSPKEKCFALAWCSRLLSITENNESSIQYLNKAKDFGCIEEIDVAEAFIVAQEGDISSALTNLMAKSSPLCNSAAFMIIAHHQGAAESLKWLEDSGFSFSDLDPDGKASYFGSLFRQGEWKAALNKAKDIREDEFDNNPVLLHFVAMSYLLNAVPEELRSTVLSQIPFSSKEFPLSSEVEYIELRKQAIKLFSQCSSLAMKIGCDDVADISSDYSLWLELRDPDSEESARLKLIESMSQGASTVLRRFPLALHFDVKVDLDAIEREVDRVTARTRGGSVHAGVARFVLAITKKDPSLISDYIDQHRSQLSKFVTKETLYLLEVEALAKSGQVGLAEQKVCELEKDDISRSVIDKFGTIIAASRGEDVIELSKVKFENTDNIDDLAYLVQVLEGKHLYKQLYVYALKLFTRTNAVSDAERLAKTFEILNRYSDLGAFLRGNRHLIDQSESLHLYWAIVLYREGMLFECYEEISAIERKYSVSSCKYLRVNLAITTGNWEELLSFIEDEWADKDNKNAEELLYVGQLSKVVLPKRAKDFIYFATEKYSDNPKVLSSAYFVATSMGWEDEANVSGWLNNAANLSGEDGVIKSISMEQLSELIPDQRKRDSSIWDALSNSSIPVSLAVKQLGMSYSSFYMLPSIINPTIRDIRKRNIIPAFSNVRHEFKIGGSRLALDYSAITTLGYLGLLSLVIKTFDKVIIPHTTLSWLFTEKKNTSFHQPSRVDEAKYIENLISEGHICVVKSKPILDAYLAVEVGDELSLMLQDASKKSVDSERPGLVVRPYPVHKAGSFMNELVDLSPYDDYLCSCTSVVTKLREKGELTSSEHKKATDYLLSSREKQWPNEAEVPDNVTLYLDSLSLTYFYHAGILGNLCRSDFTVFVHHGEISRHRELVKYETESLKVDLVIESIRTDLSTAIGNKKVEVLPLADKSNDLKIELDAELQLLSADNQFDSLVSDDRFLNRHKNISLDSGEKPVHTTLDVLDTLFSHGIISKQDWFSHRVKLRQAGYVFIPLTEEELSYHILMSEVLGTKLVETAELKIIRQSFLKLKMSYLIELPRDAEWLSNNFRLLTKFLKSLWLLDDDTDKCIARSDWLLKLMDYRGWSHFFHDISGSELAKYGDGIQINTLLIPPESISPEAKKEYWNWLDEKLIEPLKLEDPVTFAWLIKSTKQQVTIYIDSEKLEEDFQE